MYHQSSTSHRLISMFNLGFLNPNSDTKEDYVTISFVYIDIYSRGKVLANGSWGVLALILHLSNTVITCMY